MRILMPFAFADNLNAMARSLRLQPLYGLSCRQLNMQSMASTNFQTEQLSNDHVSSLYKQGFHREALEAFDFIRKTTSFRIRPSTYAHLICACSSLKSLEQGKKIHDHIQKSNCQPDLVLNNHILNMYGKCGSVKDARKVFNDMSERNLVSYTSMIAGCSQSGQNLDAIYLYIDMLKVGFIPDHFTFGSVIKACSGVDDHQAGMQLHAHVTKSEIGFHAIAQNALIAMYTKFNQITDALDVFSRISVRDLISWGSIISGFSQLGYDLEALSLFKEMLNEGVFQPNEFIFGSIFSACSALLDPAFGRQIHVMCIKFGFGRNIFAGCSLCDMYARCDLLDSARTVFYQIERPDLASWNAMFTGLAYSGNADEVFSLFSKMRRSKLNPDSVTLRSLLRACACPLALSEGMQIHSCILKMGFQSDVSVCNSLLTMYANCSKMCSAFKVFDEIGEHADSVSWNTILTVCLQNSHNSDIFRLFKLMRSISKSGPDQITISTVLRACVEASSLEMGNQIHCFTVKTGLVIDLFVMNGLIDMYAKCGSLGCARELFNSMENADVVSWSSLIVGYAQFGYGEEAIELFRKMRRSGVQPNQVTFLGVLTACSHVGLVEEGLELYTTMQTEYGTEPTREHCACVVDLLARAGHLKEAEEFIDQMAIDPDLVVWKTLLAASKTHGNVDTATRAAENILEIDPSNSSAYVLLCNMYADSGNWEGVASLRRMMRRNEVQKAPGQSWIEVKDKIHWFLAEDVLHQERGQIYSVLDELWLQMLDNGYVPLKSRIQLSPGTG